MTTLLVIPRLAPDPGLSSREALIGEQESILIMSEIPSQLPYQQAGGYE